MPDHRDDEPCAPASPLGTCSTNDADLLAECQADLARCLVVLDSAQDALWTVTQEAEHGRWGTPGYDMTLDHLYEVAKPTYDEVRDLWSTVSGRSES